MNKFVIAVILGVLMSGNCYADDQIYPTISGFGRIDACCQEPVFSTLDNTSSLQVVIPRQ